MTFFPRRRARVGLFSVAMTLTAFYVIFPMKIPPGLLTMCGIMPRLRPDVDNINVTVVTAYFDIGTFQKGISKWSLDRISIDKYLAWAKDFSLLQNPTIVFTDSKVFAHVFQNQNGSDRALSRKNLKVVFVNNRSRLFAFQQLPIISRVFADPGYPKFHPNTVVPEYSCTQHAKMDVMEAALESNVFRTEYFAWLDIGYFRHLKYRKRKFWIAVPPEMNTSRIAAGEVFTPSWRWKEARKIFRENKVWVGGGMLLGRRAVYARLVQEYRRALVSFLGAGLANTDQQVLYAMFLPQMKASLNVTTELQLFSLPVPFLMSWFYLGYHCYREEDPDVQCGPTINKCGCPWCTL